jgi:ATP-binding cassette subfamily F protein 3
MALAALTNIEKTFGTRVVFDHLNFQIDAGERVGLIGDNGSGKTTLMRLLTGEMTPDDGQVAIARSTRVGYLAQDPAFTPGLTVMDEAELAFAPLHELSHKLRDIEHEMAVITGPELDKVLARYQTVQHEFDLAGGYAWRHRLEATLLGVGLDTQTWEQDVDTLSGGQRSRLALARLLIDGGDLLLLDEPTNHLDLAATNWLEQYLLQFSGAVLLVSHDRYLLDRLATRIVWLTGAALRSFPGNYSSFRQQRQLQELTQQRAYEKQHADIEKQAEYIRRFKAGQRARQAKGREKRLDRLLISDAVVKSVGQSRHIHLGLQTDKRAGDRVLRVADLKKSFGPRTLWSDVGFDLTRGDRVGIIGPNGSGKTTLLEILLGGADADQGDIQWGANLAIGYYDQRLEDFDPEMTVFGQARLGRSVPDQLVRNVLAALLFTGNDIDKPLGLLSGGERARVAMAQLLLDRPNILLLDEPTNHLDIPSREALESALAGFDGTILCVSHDRFFLDKIVRRLLILEPPAIRDFTGNYTALVARDAQAAADARDAATARKSAAKRPAPKKAAAPASPQRNPAQSKKPSSRGGNPWSRPFGRLTVPELETNISQTEKDLAACELTMADAATYADPSRRSDVQKQFNTLTEKLRQLEAEYFTRET